MGPTPRHVLVVGAEELALHRLAPMLRREEFDLHTVAPSRFVVDLVGATPFELLVVAFPSPELPLEHLVATVRGEGSPCRRAGLILLAEPPSLEEALGYVDHGVNRVVAPDWPAARIWQAFADLLEVAPRVSLRVLLEADLCLDGGASLLCQTRNVSRSGLLVTSELSPSVGSRFAFTFFIRGQSVPVAGRAEIVRPALADRDEADGFGARFLALEPEGEERLERYIAERLSTRS